MFKILNRFMQSGLFMRLVMLIAGVVIANDTMAASVLTLSGISTNVGGAIKSVSALMEDVALICGIGFILASFFKFHQHKLNPTQVPMSQGVTLLVIGAGLAVFPHLLGTTTQAAFGESVEKIGGAGITGIIGS